MIEGLIAAVSPRWALRRQLHRRQLNRLYEAAKPSSSRKPVIGGGLSADAVLQGSNTKLRSWARYLDENHDLAGGVLDCLVTNVVGAGMALEARPLRANGSVDEVLAKEITRQWKMWTKRADVTDELPFSELQRLMCRSWVRDGEVFIHHITRPGLIRGNGIPYRVEPLEADMVPLDEHNGDVGNMAHGIARDLLGRPIFYLVYLQHPGAVWGTTTTLTSETKRVPAEAIEHVRLCKRIGQTRGVTIFAPVILRLDDIKDYEESERIAARVAASMTAFIKRSPDFAENYDTGADGVTRRDFEIEAGMVFDGLLPGEDVGMVGTDRPNSGLADFRQSQLRAVASGTGTSASTISRNYDGSYSSQRQELVESTENYKRLRNYFIAKALQPIYEQWLSAAVLSGRLRVTGDLAMAANAEWRPPAMPWIDPKKEIEAEAIAVEKGFTSRTAVIRRRGEDPQVVQSEIDADDFQPAQSVTAAPTEVSDEDETEAADRQNAFAARR